VTASGAIGGAEGLFGPYLNKTPALGSKPVTSAFSKVVGYGYQNGYYGLGARNVARAFGAAASYATVVGIAAGIAYNVYDIASCASAQK
jgi:hypothetical protein